MKSTIQLKTRSGAVRAYRQKPRARAAIIASTVGLGLTIVALPAAAADLVSASNDPVVDAASRATTPPPVPVQIDDAALYASLQPKGFNIGLPGPADTIDPQTFGLRKKLADLGIGFFGMDLINAAQNVLSGVSRGNAGTQQYNGQRFTWYNTMYMGVTYDLSRFGIPDGQLYVAGMWNWVSWQPMGPNKLGISEATYYQTMFNRQMELKLGYVTNSWEFVNYSVGGSLASSVFGPSGSIPLQGGMSNNETPTPGIDITWHPTNTLYLKGGVQRAVNPAGLQTEIRYNGASLDWTTPNSGVLYLGEAGYRQTPAEGVPYTWIRAGGAFNTSTTTSYAHPGTHVDHNSWYYLLADRQIWQTHPGSSPGRGVYLGASVMYAPPAENAVSQYYEARLYGKGLIGNRPYDLVSLVLTDTVWSSYAIEEYAGKGDMVHRDSKAVTLSYSARLARGVYAGVGVSYVNHPTTIAYQTNTGSALNVLANLNVFF
ncbi:carbohydrate porin [Paraburkholderia sp. J67]|uniref:carbohydrate porin n=1 Tax=Paraburkholderia sp. J67 TaxID=2805435 RepID=UPI002ABD515B|nr:carbohydrate porin [Paraburkholderia sp. J67]